MLADSRMPIEVSLALIAALAPALGRPARIDDRRRLRKEATIHPERGRQDLATTLALYAWHSRHHTAHITNLRARKSW